MRASSAPHACLMRTCIPCIHPYVSPCITCAHALILRGCFTFGKRRVELVGLFCRSMEMLALPLSTSTRQFR